MKTTQQYEDEYRNWLDAFIKKKGPDLNSHFQITGGKAGLHFFSYQFIVDLIKIAPVLEKMQIRTVLGIIDFKNGDILQFLRNLAGMVVENKKCAPSRSTIKT